LHVVGLRELDRFILGGEDRGFLDETLLMMTLSGVAERGLIAYEVNRRTISAHHMKKKLSSRRKAEIDLGPHETIADCQEALRRLAGVRGGRERR
jgi:hypothetical protein